MWPRSVGTPPTVPTAPTDASTRPMENGLPRADHYPARPLLEVIALGPDDAEAAQAGGADRLEVVSDMASDGLSPTVETVRQIRSVCDIDLRVMVRTDPDFSCRDQASLIGLAGDLADAGADGLVLGFLRDGALDIEPMRAVTRAVPLPWTCHRAVDHADDYGATIRAAARLSGLDQILTAGASTGLSDGLANVAAHAGAAPLMAGGGLTASHVPALRAAGVTAFHIGSAARSDWQTPVDSARVAVWRTLLDGR